LSPTLPRTRRRSHPWPIVPYVSQLDALLPDGLPDPDAATDCGFACVAGIVRALTGLSVAPGCYREALIPEHVDGRSTQADLVRLLRRLGFAAAGATYVDAPDGGREWGDLGKLRFSQHYRICLGHYEGLNFLHWVVAWERETSHVLVMDPLRGTRVVWERYAFLDAGVGSHVVVGA
jgi:ABC-type bacteriocin/lantibiotic exporter with double-glycine peptidase domain